MNRILLIVSIVSVFSFLSFKKVESHYDPNLVEITTSVYNRGKFSSIKMSRAGEHIKAKYFAFKADGETAYQRFKEWSAGKNVILLTEIGYFSGTSYEDAVPVGIRMDDGNVINQNLFSPGLDGLVIVYPSGGIACSDISEGNFYIKCGDQAKTLDVRKPLDLLDFIRCAQTINASVFQEYLLVYKDKVTIANNSSSVKRERRFLAVGRDSNGQIVHTAVHYPIQTTLLDGAKEVYGFLKNYKGMKEIIFMLNLDTGYQDVFRLYDSDGDIREDIKGTLPPEVATSLLVYYYE